MAASRILDAKTPFTLPLVDSSNPPLLANAARPRVLVLGLGNDLLTDDGVGLYVARELQRQFVGQDSIHVRETTEMGLALLDFLTGYDAAVIVDSIQTGQAPPGFIHELDAASLKQLTGGTPHFLGVGERSEERRVGEEG